MITNLKVTYFRYIGVRQSYILRSINLLTQNENKYEVL